MNKILKLVNVNVRQRSVLKNKSGIIKDVDVKIKYAKNCNVSNPIDGMIISANVDVSKSVHKVKNLTLRTVPAFDYVISIY